MGLVLTLKVERRELDSENHCLPHLGVCEPFPSYCKKMDWRDYPCLITQRLCPTNHLTISSRDNGGGRTSLVTLSGEVEKILLLVSLEKVPLFPCFCCPREDMLVAGRCTCGPNFLLETWTAVLDCQILAGNLGPVMSGFWYNYIKNNITDLLVILDDSMPNKITSKFSL